MANREEENDRRKTDLKFFLSFLRLEKKVNMETEQGGR